jgi:hypothetical protein
VVSGDAGRDRRLKDLEEQLGAARRRLVLLAQVLPTESLAFLQMDLDQLALRRGYWDPLANWSESSELTPGEIETDVADLWARLAPAPKP